MYKRIKMPNWCRNYIDMIGPAKIVDDFHNWLKVDDDEEENNWFTYFRPIPDNLKEEGWYDWCWKNWGTKWNSDAKNIEVVELRGNYKRIRFECETAWNAPLRLYRYIEEHTEFSVLAYYNEYEMGYCGCYTNGEEDRITTNFETDEDLERYNEMVPERLRTELVWIPDEYDDDWDWEGRKVFYCQNRKEICFMDE